MVSSFNILYMHGLSVHIEEMKVISIACFTCVLCKITVYTVSKSVFSKLYIQYHCKLLNFNYLIATYNVPVLKMLNLKLSPDMHGKGWHRHIHLK
jgi:hypothetical protein